MIFTISKNNKAQSTMAMAAVKYDGHHGSSKRPNHSLDTPNILADLPENVLSNLATFLPKPSCALLAVATAGRLFCCFYTVAQISNKYSHLIVLSKL